MAFLSGYWWYLQQWVFIEMEKKKQSVGVPLDSFGGQDIRRVSALGGFVTVACIAVSCPRVEIVGVCSYGD